MPLNRMLENESKPAPQRSGIIPPMVEPTNSPIQMSGLDCMHPLYRGACYDVAMLERREFGMRGRVEKPAEQPKRDFERDRPMYERLRGRNQEIDELLTRYDEISTHEAASRHGEDRTQKQRIEDRFAEVFRSLQ